MQFGNEGRAIGIDFGSGQALAQLPNFIFAGTAPANLGPATGC
jgi:hypothetical protein